MSDLTPPGPLADGGLRVTALGGISEIGRNMTVLEHLGRLLIIDCGVLFPGHDEPGVDLILPDIRHIEDRLGDVTHPVLVLAGRHDRTCVVEGGEAIAAGIPGSQLVVLEASGHMSFAEENEAYLAAVRRFLQSVP